MSTLIDEMGRVNPTLIRLAQKSGLEVSETISPDGMNSILQAHWIHRGTFRYEIQGERPTEEYIDILRELDCIDEFLAPIRTYSTFDGSLLLGTTLPRFRTRLATLKKEYDRGAHFKQVYLLGSERPLNPQKESFDDLRFPKEGLPIKKTWDVATVPLPTNEIDMMHYVVDQSDIPTEWEVIVIKTSNVALQGAGFRYANTGDTFVQWQKDTRFVDGRFLIVSNQPFVRYQETNARRILPQEMLLFGIGHMANVELPLGTFLDNLAKQLYEESLLQKRFVDS